MIESSEYSNERVNEVIFRGHGAAIASFEAKDWIDLARAALDQAGLSLAEQHRIEAVLSKANAVWAGSNSWTPEERHQFLARVATDSATEPSSATRDGAKLRTCPACGGTGRTATVAT